MSKLTFIPGDRLKMTRCVNGKNKIGYPSRSAAKKAGKLWTSKFGREFRVYECKLCGQWHLATDKRKKAKA